MDNRKEICFGNKLFKIGSNNSELVSIVIRMGFWILKV